MGTNMTILLVYIQQAGFAVGAVALRDSVSLYILVVVFLHSYKLPCDG